MKPNASNVTIDSNGLACYYIPIGEDQSAVVMDLMPDEASLQRAVEYEVV